MSLNLDHIRAASKGYARAIGLNAAVHGVTDWTEAIAALVGASLALADCGLSAGEVKSLLCAAIEDATDPIAREEIA